MHHDVTRIGARMSAVLAAGCAVVLAAASLAGAQTLSGPGGGPFASGSVVSVSGSTVDLQSTNPQTKEKTDVTVTLSDSTTYRKVQPTTASAITVGACVRVNGKGSTAKGITAATVAITGATSKDCTQAPNFSGGGPPGAGNAPTDAGNGTPPSSIPTTRRQRPKTSGLAFGTVRSVAGDKVVVKAAVLPNRPRQQGSKGSGSQTSGSQDSTTKGSSPKLKTKNVTVTLSSSTTITETVAATAADITVGACATANGTGDSSAITADSVTISQPENGSCSAGFVTARPQV
jgi:hypothetical protein